MAEQQMLPEMNKTHVCLEHEGYEEEKEKWQVQSRTEDTNTT